MQKEFIQKIALGLLTLALLLPGVKANIEIAKIRNELQVQVSGLDVKVGEVSNANKLLGADISRATPYIPSTLSVSTLTISGLNKGSVLFAGTGGLVSQNSNFYFDNTTGTLRVGTTVTSTLVASSSVKFTGGDVFGGTEYKIGKTANATSLSIEVPTGGSINLNSSGATMLSVGQFSAVVSGPIVANSFRSGNNAASNLWFTPLASNDASTHNIGFGIGGTESAVSVTSTGDGAGGHGAYSIGLGINSARDSLAILVATTTIGNGGPVTSPSNLKMRIIQENATQIPLILQGQSGQTSYFMQGVSNAGALLFGVSSNGGIVANSVSGSYLGGSGPDANWQLTVDSNGTTNGVLKVLGRAGLTGDLFLVATSSGNVFRVNNLGNVFATGTLHWKSLATNITGNGVCHTTDGQITDAGAAACVPSALRFKQNIAVYTGSATKVLDGLKVRTFEYKEGVREKHPNEAKDRYGFIAEEVRQVDNRLVAYDANGEVLTLNFEEITALNVKAIQELNERVKTLEERVQTLEKLLKR